MSDVPHDTQTFLTQIGSKATVQRFEHKGDNVTLANRKLCDLGLELNPLPDQPELLTYFGSAAVHIYFNETLRQMFFVSQTQPLALYKCPEPLAAKSFSDLLQTMKAQYGKRRSKLRSGF